MPSPAKKSLNSLLLTHSYDAATGILTFGKTDFQLNHCPRNPDELAQADCDIHDLLAVLGAHDSLQACRDQLEISRDMLKSLSLTIRDAQAALPARSKAIRPATAAIIDSAVEAISNTLSRVPLT